MPAAPQSAAVPETTPAAGATSTPEARTVSASHDAVAKDDFGAFQGAEKAKRFGTPKADVTVKVERAAPEAKPAEADGDAPGGAERKLSRAQLDANERTRTAVERATADVRAENDRLKAQLAGRDPSSRREPEKAADAPPADDAKKTPAWKKYAALPDAPKLADFDSVEDYSAAMGLFIADKRHDDRVAESRESESREERTRALVEDNRKFGERMTAAKTADPDLASKIAPALLNARPLRALSAEERGRATFSNLAAEVAFRSDRPAELMLRLSADSAAEATRIASLHPSQWEDALLRLDGTLGTAPGADAPADDDARAARSEAPRSPVSTAPPPAPVHRRPSNSAADSVQDAVKRNDFDAFQKHERQKRERAARAGAV